MNRKLYKTLFYLTFLSLYLTCSYSFHLPSPSSFTSLHSTPPDSDSSDPPSDFDWDADWKRVTSGEIKPKEKGLKPPSFLEKKAVQIKKSVTPQTPIKITPPSTSDPKLWIGLILLFALGVNFLGAVNGGGVGDVGGVYVGGDSGGDGYI
ncbi:hypothetical protein TrST_g5189 [Triparma strigata]|uniref:Glycine-rich protein n=1 Tax=Triparma strigata TaxID=1606541 RepID=A0A9W7EWF7_9STRA|nr:hypothetical protein TrST_g5189 [Triparma strigata]